LLYADFVGPEAAFWKSAFESTSRSLAQQLKEQLETTQRQMATISAQREDIAVLSTPVLQLAEDVLALPVVGRVDAQRAAVMSETLLQEVVAHRAFGVILDLTGLTAVDSSTVTHFIKLGRAIRMLGAHTVMTGISPETSQLLVGADIQLAEIVTQRSLEAGIRYLETIRRR
jgi:rsbT co-antagonist protein RsbR